MPIDILLTAIVVVAPALYAWWSGRQLVRSLDDPALPERLQSRMQRIAQVTAIDIVLLVFLPTSAVIGVPLMLLALLASRYPLRRAVYDETWSFAAFIRYGVFSFL